MTMCTIYRFLIVLLMFACVQGGQAGAASTKAERSEQEGNKPAVLGVQQINPTTWQVLLQDDKRLTLDFYGDNIVRLFRDDQNGAVRDPQATPPATILATHARKPVHFDAERGGERGYSYVICTPKIKLVINKQSGLLTVVNVKTGKTVIEQSLPIELTKNSATITLKTEPKEYFYGGGVQNGRFSHKGKTIAIENQNSWTDGGVVSPTPFYWSTKGYGMLWHTFKKGEYDFGNKDPQAVTLSHMEPYLDLFFTVNDSPAELLGDFYQLTGNPVLLPKFAFYQGHLNAYNRDYWKEDPKGIPFEDGKRYKESQKDTTGIQESLNGEKGNYQFSARAVIDRYHANDMPLGWMLPNDGYGAGYGQTDSLKGNVQNLKEFGDYAKKYGVEIGLWTQSDLYPKPDIDAVLQRDIVQEVRDAGVRVLKTDVAWVGPGYSFGLNGVSDVAHVMEYYGNDARPFIISLDGWAGTQRYAGIWSGDQTGGEWEYIRFHIPTYIGAGLSGQPNISSDMDGIFGGKKPVINVRDFQWKTFSPMELNMDGWGSNEKYPHAFGEPYTSINRWYLKLKSILLPYTYSIAEQAVHGLPMIRAIFLSDPNPYTLGKATQYEYLYGPYLLIAPVYQATKSDDEGNDVRHNIYLPPGEWFDFFTGDCYQGGKIYNDFATPLWKLPVFVKNGAILPLANPTNQPRDIDKALRMIEFYPGVAGEFVLYDDDGTTNQYRRGEYVRTKISAEAPAGDKRLLTVHPATGNFAGFEKRKRTQFIVNVTQKPSGLKLSVNGKSVPLKEVASLQALEQSAPGENVYFYDPAPELNRFATPGSEFTKKHIIKNPQLHVKTALGDVCTDKTELLIEGFVLRPADHLHEKTGELAPPANLAITQDNISPYTLTPTWTPVENADYYEVKFDNMLYTAIQEPEFLFEDLRPETPYAFSVRAVNKDGHSDWAYVKAKTAANPLEFAIAGISGETSVPNQGNTLSKLFDFNKKDAWHTKYNEKAVPFDLVMDLKTVNKLDKFHYIPREDVGNGTLLQGTVYYSPDKNNWTQAGTFTWDKTGDTKVFTFPDAPSARYIKLAVTQAAGDYGSGREIFVFKVPGTESYLPGDINNDGKVDANDMTSYINYTGLRQGDSDFEGYVSRGDVNKNHLIDAYDISVVATQLPNEEQAEGEATEEKKEEKPAEQKSAAEAATRVGGSLSLQANTTEFEPGQEVTITVSGKNLALVNALGFALPYNPADLEFTGIEAKNMQDMQNLTNDRLHTDGEKVLYPTFVNMGKKRAIEGSKELFVIQFKARRKGTFTPQMQHGMLVDGQLNVQSL